MDDIKHLDGIDMGFASGALPGGDLALRGVAGVERLSQLFDLDLLLARHEGPLAPEQIDELLRAPCAVAFGSGPSDVVRGLLRSIRRIDSSAHETTRYVAHMVPTVWLLTLARSNRVFQNLSVPAIVAQVLERYGLHIGIDFEIRLTPNRPYAVREYVVQYEESDWDFVQRWLEDEGLFYWFDHAGKNDRLVIADANAHATPIEGPELPYRKRNNLATDGAATVWDWEVVQQRVPARVVVRDYNYRRPDLDLASPAPVDAVTGFGSVVSYGEHFKTPDEGAIVARLRAERMLCERRTFFGRSDCSALRVGHVLTLADHFDAVNDGRFLITSVTHRVGVAADAGDASAESYSARFEAIPFDVPYRPERRTPWPTIRGVLHAHIDADTDGTYAQLDELGRYRVKLPFDASDQRGARASRWIRMAQPSSGAGYGTHFPLHKGTEVLLAHIDGDPDRPVIVGSVPNAHTVSPATKTNATQSVIRTASGIRVEMEDLQR